MSWVKLDDGFADHPKIAKVGAVGAWLQVQALCYANKNLTDGFVPFGVARSFVSRGVEYTDEEQRVWTLAETCGQAGRELHEVDWPAIMVNAGLWEQVPSGYLIHDYDQYQPSREQVLAKRSATSQRVKRYRDRNAVGNGVGTLPPVPVPVSRSRTLKKEDPRAPRLNVAGILKDIPSHEEVEARRREELLRQAARLRK